ncbi:DUF5330 domain-containing protein [Aliihoeflea aestuarii]|jgi:hypothetical protein|uniref:DUF5330 domain-containing protein n=1 Tax=Aliihoeflea aestuarii TaxID=453840 RepID=UPI0020931AA1|nr:DUF5330 domain-containing protein [Aliihoeflea aestuarii]
MIGFLFKSAFWLSIALLFIPLAPSGETDEPQVGAVDAFFAARDAISDVSGICERKPEVCEVGGALVGSLGMRAREGARIAYEALDGQFGETPAESQLAAPTPAIGTYDETVLTGSVPASAETTF